MSRIIGKLKEKLRPLVQLIKDEPALFTALAQAGITLAVQFGLHLTAAETGSVLAATTAGLAFVAAVYTRPFQLAAASGLVTAVGTLLCAFGVHHATPGMVADLNALLVTVFAFFGVRPQVTPLARLKRKAAAE